MLTTTKSIGSVEEFYAHALAIEREAEARYWEFAHQLFLNRNNQVAELFLELASREAEHLCELERKAVGRALPRLDALHYCWGGFDSPEAVAMPVAQALMNPRRALRIALENERRAKAFYEQVCDSSARPEVKVLAGEFATEEGRHIACIERALEAGRL